MHGHHKSDARSLALHRAALENLKRRPELKDACLQLAVSWKGRPDLAHARQWLEQWSEMLAQWTDDRICATVLDEIQGQALRQCSPLGPAISPRERWRILADVEAALET